VSQGEDEEPLTPQIKKPRLQEPDEESNPKPLLVEHDEERQPKPGSSLIEIDEESNSSQDLQPRRTARMVTEMKEDQKGVLRECLFYMQKSLQRYMS